MFLKKVREDSEDKRWKKRGGDDEMMRAIWIAEQRRREERQRREAMGLEARVEEEEFLSLGRFLGIGGRGCNANSRVDEIMADEVALMEEAELEALIANQTAPDAQTGQQDHMPPDEEMDSLLFSMGEQVRTTPSPQLQPSPETLYGSDDEEYDHIFMDVIQEENRIASQSSHPTDGDQDMMDMS